MKKTHSVLPHYLALGLAFAPVFSMTDEGGGPGDGDNGDDEDDGQGDEDDENGGED